MAQVLDDVEAIFSLVLYFEIDSTIVIMSNVESSHFF